MTHRTTRLWASGLAALIVQLPLLASAETPDRPAGTVEIVMNGQVRRLHPHNGRLYVEAVRGREYGIRLRNPYGVRVAVALAVDGLNTIDGRESTATRARKWVLEPYQTVVIGGWQTSRTEARQFEFTTEARSYGAARGKTANLGVISAVFFRERVAPAPVADAESDRGRSLPAPSPASPAPRSQSAQEATSGGRAAERVSQEMAATGMGRQTEHVVTQVWLDLEDRPAHSVDIRYEFRPQLISLGVLPRQPATSPLERRERARGFESEFAPVPPAFRR